MRAIISIFGAFISSRLLCALFVYLGHASRPYLSDVPGGWQGVDNWWLNPWTTYDSFWFLQIAAEGYDIQSTAFFPLYPAMLRCFGPDQLDMVLAGVILSNVFFLAALWVVYRLTRLEHNVEIADFTIWLLAYSPAAVFFSAVYTEPLFLLLITTMFLAVRQERWMTASISGGMAALTRNPGFLLTAALLIETSHGPKHNNGFLWRYSLALVPLMVFLTVQAWFGLRFDKLLAGIVSQEYFHRQLQWPWKPVLNDLNALVEAGHAWNYYMLIICSLTLTIGLFVLAWKFRKQIHPGYLVFVLGITLMNLTYAREQVPHTINQIRYMGALFPVAQMLALVLYKPSRYQTLLMAGYFYMFVIMSYLFGRKVLF